MIKGRRNGRRVPREDLSNHVEGYRKRAGTRLSADPGMHADNLAGEHPNLHSLLAEPVPI